MSVIEIPDKTAAAPFLIGEPSFADAIAAIAAADDLSPDKQRYWSTSLRQLACYLDRPIATIPGRIAAIGGAVKKLHPESLGVHAKTFANHRANVRTALLWFNRQTLGAGRNAPMASAYRALWSQIGAPYARDMLSPFFRYLSGLGIEPGDVSDDHIDGFVAYRQVTGFRDVKLGWHRALVRHWNDCVGSIAVWPKVILTEPLPGKSFTGPRWRDFAQGLRIDIDAHCAKLAKRRRGFGGRILRPCSASTIAMRRRELIAAVRAAVKAGIPLDDLKVLRDLLQPDRVATIIDHYWQQNGESPSLYTIDLAGKLLSLARSEAGFSPADLERLEEIRIALDEHRKSGLTEKNRALVRQVIQSDVWSKVVELPRRSMAEARSDSPHSPTRSAVTAGLAIAIRILVMAPIRIQNLASIRLGTNLVRPGGPSAPYHLVFPDYDVKNRMPLAFPLDTATTAMIDEYVHVHRPHLMRGRRHDNLFPGAGHDQKITQGLGEQISRRLWKVLGLKITPHQFRHAAAAIILKHDPGNYEWARRVLGHHNIATTIRFYIGLETIEAARRFGEIVTAMTPAAPLASAKKRRRN